jgi:hypothetical protein
MMEHLLYKQINCSWTLIYSPHILSQVIVEHSG